MGGPRKVLGPKKDDVEGSGGSGVMRSFVI